MLPSHLGPTVPWNFSVPSHVLWDAMCPMTDIWRSKCLGPISWECRCMMTFHQVAMSLTVKFTNFSIATIWPPMTYFILALESKSMSHHNYPLHGFDTAMISSFIIPLQTLNDYWEVWWPPWYGFLGWSLPRYQQKAWFSRQRRPDYRCLKYLWDPWFLFWLRKQKQSTHNWKIQHKTFSITASIYLGIEN